MRPERTTTPGPHTLFILRASIARTPGLVNAACTPRPRPVLLLADRFDL
ncbi:MAG: hypothetical protein IMW89_02340 [Ktedonobacteraceae bacterium]|nr:hypothetical protein [Ktedonobacteraceae bacterium]